MPDLIKATCPDCGHLSTEHSPLAGCLEGDCLCETSPQAIALADAMRRPLDAEVIMGTKGLAEGRKRRDEGVEAAGTTAPGALVTAWKARANKALEELIREGSYFSADDLVAAVGMPPRPNMLGGVFIGARRAGLIEPVGYTQAHRPEAHARVQRTWKGA